MATPPEPSQLAPQLVCLIQLEVLEAGVIRNLARRRRASRRTGTPGSSEVHQVANLLDRPDLELRREACAAAPRPACRPRAASTNTRRRTASGRRPRRRGCRTCLTSIGIGIAACSSTALRTLRTAAITGSNVARRSSCRYGSSGGGRFGAACIGRQLARQRDARSRTGPRDAAPPTRRRCAQQRLVSD